MTVHYYCFEAKSIQSFILKGGKLRDMVGASEMVERVFTIEFKRILKALDIAESPMPRCGGGALTLPCRTKADAEAFRDLWSFHVQQKAPGMPFVHAVVSVEDRKDLPEAQVAALRAQRSRPLPRLPLAAPFAEREPRTANVAVTHWRPPSESTPISIDEETLAKRTLVEKLNKELSGRKGDEDYPFQVIRKLEFEETYQWPLHGRLQPDQYRGESALLGVGEEGYLAIVHADGNRLGKLLHQVRQHANDRSDYDQVMERFSKAVTSATNRAAKKAITATVSANLIKNVIPLRPLILGGDDLTFIMRAESAIAFTRSFLERFQETTKHAFAKSGLAKDIPILKKGMTAYAGIAFMKPNMPFGLVYRLASELCDKAKADAKARVRHCKDHPPSCLAFHRVTTAAIDRLDLLRQRELNEWSSFDEETPQQNLSIQVSLQPYAVEREAFGMPFLDDVLDLGKELKAFDQRGPLREILRLSHLSPERMERAVGRWLENLGKHPEGERRLKGWTELFGRIVQADSAGQAAELMNTNTEEEQARWQRAIERIRGLIPMMNASGKSPLGDLIALIEVNGLGEDYE